MLCRVLLKRLGAKLLGRGAIDDRLHGNEHGRIPCQAEPHLLCREASPRDVANNDALLFLVQHVPSQRGWPSWPLRRQ